MAKSNALNERQLAVAATMRMRLTRAEALAYLKGEGFQMSTGTLGRIKAWLKRTSLQRLYSVAQFDFEDQHMARIEMCEHIQQLMWKEFFLEKDSYRRVLILEKIKELQPYLSTYYEATKLVIQKRDGGRQDTASLPNNATADQDAAASQWTT